MKSKRYRNERNKLNAMGSKKTAIIDAEKKIQDRINQSKKIKQPEKRKMKEKPLLLESKDYQYLYIPGKTPRPKAGYFPIEICSILPHAFIEAAWLHDHHKLDEFAQIGHIINKSIALGKWTIHLLVNYKREYLGEPSGHKEFYKADENYDVNLKELTEKTTNSDLSYLKFNPHDHGELAEDDQEFMLWNYINKCNQILKSLPEGTDVGNLQKFIDHCLSSSFRICTKLKEYTDYFSTDLMDTKKFNRKVPW